MSKTDPSCYPRDGWRDDRDWLDRAYDDWRDGADGLSGIHRVLYLFHCPFRVQFDPKTMRGPRDTYAFTGSSSWSVYFARAEKAAKRAEKRKQKEMHHARLDHEINRLLNACAPFPQPKTSN